VQHAVSLDHRSILPFEGPWLESQRLPIRQSQLETRTSDQGSSSGRSRA
jgi:hypothetical protein